jgi:hypothetical protein
MLERNVVVRNKDLLLNRITKLKTSLEKNRGAGEGSALSQNIAPNSAQAIQFVENYHSKFKVTFDKNITAYDKPDADKQAILKDIQKDIDERNNVLSYISNITSDIPYDSDDISQDQLKEIQRATKNPSAIPQFKIPSDSASTVQTQVEQTVNPALQTQTPTKSTVLPQFSLGDINPKFEEFERLKRELETALNFEQMAASRKSDKTNEHILQALTTIVDLNQQISQFDLTPEQIEHINTKLNHSLESLNSTYVGLTKKATTLNENAKHLNDIVQSVNAANALTKPAVDIKTPEPLQFTPQARQTETKASLPTLEEARGKFQQLNTDVRNQLYDFEHHLERTPNTDPIVTALKKMVERNRDVSNFQDIKEIVRVNEILSTVVTLLNSPRYDLSQKVEYLNDYVKNLEIAKFHRLKSQISQKIKDYDDPSIRQDSMKDALSKLYNKIDGIEKELPNANIEEVKRLNAELDNIINPIDYRPPSTKEALINDFERSFRLDLTKGMVLPLDLEPVRHADQNPKKILAQEKTKLKNLNKQLVDKVNLYTQQNGKRDDDRNDEYMQLLSKAATAETNPLPNIKEIMDTNAELENFIKKIDSSFADMKGASSQQPQETPKGADIPSIVDAKEIQQSSKWISFLAAGLVLTGAILLFAGPLGFAFGAACLLGGFGLGTKAGWDYRKANETIDALQHQKEDVQTGADAKRGIEGPEAAQQHHGEKTQAEKIEIKVNGTQTLQGARAANYQATHDSEGKHQTHVKAQKGG